MSVSETLLSQACLSICTLNRAPFLARALHAIRHLRTAPMRTLIVVGPSTDHTDQVLARHRSHISVIHCPEPNLAHARNLALEAAKTPIVAFLDDDAVPEPDWLCHLLGAFADDRVAAAGGPIRDRSGISWQARRLAVDGLGRRRALADEEPPGPDETLSLTGAGFAVRREAALAIGGFDETYAYYLEETDLQRRLAQAGWKLAFVPEAEVHHEFAASSLRTTDRIPLDLRPLGRSLAYFAARHAPPGPARDEAIRQRLAEDQAERRARLDRLVARDRLDAATAARLLAGLREGHAEGLALAARPPSRQQRLLRAPALAEARALPPPPRAARRIAIVLPALAEPGNARVEALRLARTLATRGHEITLIAGRAKRPSVRFRHGVWRHRLGPARLADGAFGRRRATRSFLRDALAELARVAPRRDPEMLVALTGLPGRLIMVPFESGRAAMDHQLLPKDLADALLRSRRPTAEALPTHHAQNAEEAMGLILAALGFPNAETLPDPAGTAIAGI